jgi:hypothetical protein
MSNPVEKSIHHDSSEGLYITKGFASHLRLLLILGISLILTLLVFVFLNIYKNKNYVTTFYECVQTPGSQIIESDPNICITQDGRRITQPLMPPSNSEEIINNPSDIPNTTNIGTACKISGCSQEICQNAYEESAVSTCVYEERFNCYQSATCEVQPDGNCGWTPTDELTLCLSQYE